MPNPTTNDEDISKENLPDVCVVCFKNVGIFSIGECDHPVCYECSTRMRVLCQQNECPICRKSLSKVIFTNTISKYRDLETKNRSEYYNKRYKIAFQDTKIQNAFYTLLDHPCRMCKSSPFHSFGALKDHVRREHEMFYCDICTEHLRIFSFERKCYNRHDLGMHRRKGDADNTSHRGHPLCQYCDCRYLDRDELFRHLRKEHYYCHFCDADGSNEFYADYDSLRNHFRADHFLCEEGDCIREQFTAVFRSDIDLRAHIANVHGKSLNKQQAKQTRTLQLEIRLGHRPNSQGHRGRSSQQDNEPGNLHFRNNSSYDNDGYRTKHESQQIPPASIDAQNEQEFPSLGGSSLAATSVTLIRPNMSNFRKSGPAGLARTKENFPDLGPSTSLSGIVLNKNSTNNQLPTSAILKSNLKPSHHPNANSSMTIHVSNRPISSSAKTFTKNKDFPALPGHSPLFEEDMVYTPSTNNLNSAVSAKHRILVDDYVSIVNPSTSSKIQLVQNNEIKPKKILQENKMKLSSTNDFPALTPASIPMVQPPQLNWGKNQRQKNFENRKPHPAPILLHMDKKIVQKTNEQPLQKEKNNRILDSEDNNNIKKRNIKQNDIKNNKQQTQKKSVETKNNQNNNEIKNNNRKPKNDPKLLNGFTDVTNSLRAQKVPPPGFDKVKSVKPPPGFQSITLNSIAKPANNLTFTTSLGESYKIIPDNLYVPPANADIRNKELPYYFQNSFQNQEGFNQFRQMSAKFRQGEYGALTYFEHCKNALQNKFDDIFPELLALLPDISKQQDLYLEYQQYLKNTSKTPELHQKLEMCSVCKQILKTFDVDDHVKKHDLNSNFPNLM